MIDGSLLGVEIGLRPEVGLCVEWWFFGVLVLSTGEKTRAGMREL